MNSDTGWIWAFLRFNGQNLTSRRERGLGFMTVFLSLVSIRRQNREWVTLCSNTEVLSIVRQTTNCLTPTCLFFFPAESLSVRQSRHRIGSIYFHFMAVENINRRILLESLTHRFLPSISHADRKRKAYRRRLNENNFVLDGRLGEV